jgi:ribosomal protein S18 acetylase RimI-like enzyme
VLAIRQFRPADLEALYAISLETGHEGGDASRLYEDGRLIGHVYSAPYAVLEPGLTLVVDDNDGVAGFAVGALDTNSWQERLEAEWWPKLRRQYDDPSAIPSSKWSADQRRAFAIHHPERRPQQVTEAYPAHLHLNLSARIQGRGTGAKLFSAWMAHVSKYGGKAMHVGVNRANVRAVRFWSKQGFGELRLENDPSGRTIWMGRP